MLVQPLPPSIPENSTPRRKQIPFVRINKLNARTTTSTKHSRKFDASTKANSFRTHQQTKCSYNHFHQAFQKIRRLDESKFLSYASITTSTKHSRNTIKGGTTQTTPVDPQQQASTHSSRPVNIQLLTSHHYTTRTWKINQPDEPATHCRIQRPSEHSRTTSQQHTAASRDLLNIAEYRASDTLPYPETAERHTFTNN
ncbi:uncharacterized protein LOC143919987 [Arctopsyche grandis]|uniref:uncharacterized protein LOC143919987 n=1 Tax=Arctopsyche grandis TaxID=121162 RepID=UPI00406D6638